MLYSVILGESNCNNDWTIAKDNYGNDFFTNESIHQRVRLGKNVESTLNEVKSGENYKVYDIPGYIFFSNNNKNMNINIVNFWTKNLNERKSHVDPNLMYLTLATKDFKMLDYSVGRGVNIIQTYHMVNEYVGCALTFTDENPVISVKGFNKVTKRYCIYEVGFDNGELDITEITVVPRDDLKKLTSLNKKYGNFSLGFKMIVPSDKLITKTYIVNDNDWEKMTEITSNIKDAIVIAFSDSEIAEFDDEAKQMLNHIILGNNIRAVTLCNIHLPKSFCKEYRILYMFNYDIENNKISCIRSN